MIENIQYLYQYKTTIYQYSFIRTVQIYNKKTGGRSGLKNLEVLPSENTQEAFMNFPKPFTCPAEDPDRLDGSVSGSGSTTLLS